jgi:hypothetical protein
MGENGMALWVAIAAATVAHIYRESRNWTPLDPATKIALFKIAWFCGLMLLIRVSPPLALATVLLGWMIVVGIEKRN